MSPIRSLAVALLAFATVTAGQARADVEVDLALVLAVDVSYSMDPEEQALQREGYVQAFRSAAVADAIERGALGRIAVTFVEWAGHSDQKVVVPWTVLDSSASVASFADTLAAKPIWRSYWTSISATIDVSVRLLEGSGMSATRRVIDVSGDGPNNQGRLVTEARADAIAKGITINGLPVMLKAATGRWDMRDLDLYYRDCVIGGPGAFMIPVRERDRFVEAVRTKILREIAAVEPDGPVIRHAQFDYGGDCRAGERRGRGGVVD